MRPARGGSAKAADELSGARAALVEARAAHVDARTTTEGSRGRRQRGDRWCRVYTEAQGRAVLLAVECYSEGRERAWDRVRGE